MKIAIDEDSIEENSVATDGGHDVVSEQGKASSPEVQ